MRSVPVELGERRYDVTVGDGARHRLAEAVAPPCPARPGPPWSPRSGIGVEVDPGIPADRFIVPDGEEAKSLGAVEELCRGFARAGIGRSDVIVAVGGGVVTDLAGFAAARSTGARPT